MEISNYLLNRLTLAAVIVVIVLAGCGIKGSYTEVISVVKEPSRDISVYFCPRQACEDKLAEFILTADRYVHCGFYDLDLPKVIDALKQKRLAGIDVGVVIDNANYELVEDLDFVRQDTSSQLSHNKFCVVDGKAISSGSFNPTDRGAYYNNNNLIIIASSSLANNYEQEFQELWSGVFGKGELVANPIIYLNETRVENYFCPEDGCGERIKNVLKKAEKEIRFMVFSFTHEGIANTLLLKIQDGVKVGGVFEKRGAGSEYSKYKVLKYQGDDIRKDNNSYVMHHKVFIIDDRTVITGSFNPSKNADTRNDENILIITDEEIAGRYLEEFGYIWINLTTKD